MNERGLATFSTKQIYRFLCFQNIMTWLSHPADKYLFKVKSKSTILTCWLRSKSATKTPERCHAVFIFNFEHIQQINLICLLLTLDMYFSVWCRIESTKKLKCTLNNRTVYPISLVSCVSRHGLNNPYTIESNVHMIIVTELWLGGGWACWNFYEGRIWGSGAGDRIIRTPIKTFVCARHGHAGAHLPKTWKSWKKDHYLAVFYRKTIENVKKTWLNLPVKTTIGGVHFQLIYWLLLNFFLTVSSLDL